VRRLASLVLLAAAAAGCGEDSVEVKPTRVLQGFAETRPTHDVPTRIQAFTARRAFVFLASGRVLETADAGRSWSRVRVRSPFGAPRFLDRAHWLASRGRSLYETRDGGRTWRFARRLTSPFRAGHFVDERFAYACRRACTLTDDGGRTSTRIGPPRSLLCRSPHFGAPTMAFSDATHGLAICGGVPGAGNQQKEFWATNGRRWRRLGGRWGYGYLGRIEPLGRDVFVHHSGRLNDQITEDGGEHWRGALPPESATFASWVDRRVGWAFERHGGDVFRTLDGGRSWRRVAPKLWPRLTSFCDPRFGFGAGEPWLSGPARGQTVYATVDGGRRWTRRSQLPAGYVISIACVSRDDVFAVAYPARDGAGFQLRRSRDGGRHWPSIPLPSDATIPTFVSADVFFAVGDKGALLATRDGGRTWQRLRPGADPVVAFAFRSARVGFVVLSPDVSTKRLPPQQLLRTSDGGRSWRAVPVRVPRLSLGTLAAAEGTFWLFGTRCARSGAPCKPLLLRTRDDGRHWDAIEIRGEPPTEAHFASSSVGVVDGVRRLLVTRDGGVTWRWERRGGF
jgi:photosystem II stability/assembly factor-like uncharacterized protein